MEHTVPKEELRAVELGIGGVRGEQAEAGLRSFPPTGHEGTCEQYSLFAHLPHPGIILVVVQVSVQQRIICVRCKQDEAGLTATPGYIL